MIVLVREPGRAREGGMVLRSNFWTGGVGYFRGSSFGQSSKVFYLAIK